MSKNQILEASLLAFNAKDNNIFNEQLDTIQKAGIQYIHYDVMDGKFVPEIAYGPEHLQTLYLRGIKANVHIMAKNPMKYVKNFLTYPCNAITFHPEPISKFQAKRIIHKIKNAHVLAGIAIKPNTDPFQYKDILSECDIVTVMSVEPGYGGQSFMGAIALKQILSIEKIKNEVNPNLIIQLDGGVNCEVMELTAKHINNFISGSFLMKQKDPSKIVKFLEKL